MDSSRFLAKVIGIYLVIVSIILACDVHRFMNYVDSLIHDMPVMFVTGFFTLILGILMVVAHNIWQFNWRLIVTVLAWVTLIKGITLIIYPQLTDAASTLFIQNTTAAYAAAGIDLLLGLILIYFGFRTSRSNAI